MLEAVLLHGGPAALSRGSRRGRILILAYHNVVPHGHEPRGDGPLHLSQALFAEHLDRLLAENVAVVDLSEALRDAGAMAGGRHRPRVAITFDDAYAGALSAGLDELTIRQMPATIFVAPGLLGGRSFWWDVLAESGELDENRRQHALERQEGRTSKVLAQTATDASEEYMARHNEPLPPYARSVDESGLRAAASRPGVTFASHTWSHPNLTSLSEDQCREELLRPLDWLREQFSNLEPWLAYPYGLHSPVVERQAEAVGYEAALRVCGGWIEKGATDPYRVPRLNVPAGLSGPGLSLRLAGLLCR